MSTFGSVRDARTRHNYLLKSISGSLDTTLSLDEAQAELIEVSATLTASVNLVIPAHATNDVGEVWAIFNNTSGAFTLTVKGSTGSGVAIAQGRVGLVRWNGTNMVAHFDDASLMNAATKGANSNITALTGLSAGIQGSGGISIAGSVGGNSSTPAAFTFAVAAPSFASDANKTLSAAEYACPIQAVVSGVSLTATRDLIVPLTAGAVWFVYNNTTGSQSIRVIGATGTGVPIASGKVAIVRADSVNITRVTADATP
jgi:hypothetical protein